MKTNINTPSLAVLTKTIIDEQGFAFLAGTYPTNRLGGSDGNYLALAIDDLGRVHRFTGFRQRVTQEAVETVSAALEIWRQIVDNPWHGFESSWEATERFLMGVGRDSTAEPQEAQSWALDDARIDEAAVLALIHRKGLRLVLGAPGEVGYEALAVTHQGEGYMVTSTGGAAISYPVTMAEAFASWRHLLNSEGFRSRNDGVEAFLIGQGRHNAHLEVAC